MKKRNIRIIVLELGSTESNELVAYKNGGVGAADDGLHDQVGRVPRVVLPRSPNQFCPESSLGYGSILSTSLAYIVPSIRGSSPWRPDAVMSTTGHGWHSVLWIFKGRQAHRTPRDVRCSSSRWTLPPAEPFPRWAGC
ncbi:UNVERIFIED_CONTAM: hypothetical protein Sradi_3790200 [Sesamum radiatum]|uniref:Uncharacterized protein n=1 Tax=Sesamum radiatum TaxID=300843 RepID=A0AAW2Q074_SESRA